MRGDHLWYFPVRKMKVLFGFVLLLALVLAGKILILILILIL
jgi:hypothetical protein